MNEMLEILNTSKDAVIGERELAILQEKKNMMIRQLRRVGDLLNFSKEDNTD
jgi:hypothetical protein